MNRANIRRIEDIYINTLTKTIADSETRLKPILHNVIVDMLRTYPTISMISNEFLELMSERSRGNPVLVTLLSNMYLAMRVDITDKDLLSPKNKYYIDQILKDIEYTVNIFNTNMEEGAININVAKYISTDMIDKDKVLTNAKYPALSAMVILSLYLDINSPRLQEYYNDKP